MHGVILLAAVHEIVGALPSWLTLLSLVAVAWLFIRGGGSTAITSLQAANQVLEKRVHELEVQAKADAATIAELRGRTDVSIALKPVLESAVAHEARAQERHEAMLRRADATLEVMGMIADRLGPDGTT